jgi:ankyrin repeat protein
MLEPASDNLRLDFALAVSSGDMGPLKNFLAAHPGALQWDDVMGGTALRKAVAHGSPNLEVVRFLIEQGSDINAPDKDGMTPLMYAALHAEREVLKLLLDMDVKTELTDKNGQTAAQHAFACDHADVAELLLAHVQHKRDAAEAARVAGIEDEAAQAHKGLDRKVVVLRPLVMIKRAS